LVSVDPFADSFWAGHFDFGRPTPSGRPWLIGSGRAGEIVVNVVLPFLHALGQARDEGDLSDRAIALYRRYPTTSQNRVTREMALQLGGPDGARHARTACRQQGLIHLYKHWCNLRDCGHCPALRSAGRQSPLGPGFPDRSQGAGFA
jgi:hypothetical protein